MRIERRASPKTLEDIMYAKTAMSDLGSGLLHSLGFAVSAIILLMIGYVVVDLLTPGKLSDLIWRQRNMNAAITAASGLLAVGIIIYANLAYPEPRDFKVALLNLVAYTLLGILLYALSFKLIDLLTPGKLGETVTHEYFHPAVMITAVVSVVIGLVVAAAIA